MTEYTDLADQYYKIHSDYVEVIFTDDMTDQALHAVHQKSDETANKWNNKEKPLLVLVNLKDNHKPNIGQFKEKVQFLETEGLKAVAIYCPNDGIVKNLVTSVISSFSSVLPIKYFSNLDEALNWLHSDFNT